MRNNRAIHSIWATTFLIVGLVGFISHSPAGVWGPLPRSLGHPDALIVVCATFSLVIGLGLLWTRTSLVAALLLFVVLVIWTVVTRLPFLIRAPLVEGSYQSCGESIVLITAAWIVCVSLAGRSQIAATARDPNGLRFAYILYGLALVAFGVSHYVYLNLTAPLVPNWLPGAVFWAYVTGAIYVLAGLGIIANFCSSLALLSAALEATIITATVWPGVLLREGFKVADLQEACESLAIAAGAWVMASYVLARRCTSRLSNDGTMVG